QVERPTTLVVHLRADPPDTDTPDTDTPDTDTPDADGPGAEVSGAVDDRPPAWIEGGPPVPVSVAGRLTCTAAVQAMLVDRRGNPLFLGRTRRLVTRAQLRALQVRDRGRCVFPGCTSTRHLQAHHVRWWRHGGPTDLDNLALVCAFHHILIHDHGYRMDVEPDGFVFARPDGTEVPATGAPTSGTAEHLVTAGVDDTTITPRWGGEHLDRDHFLTWLLPARRREETASAA
ncbi:MAG: DUF222 domain-containing protein, partial [Pseudonocardia sp.]|nr:DUF222 domain-containing protein [Pseudonocardia sp.]